MENMEVKSLFDILKSSYNSKKVFLTGHTGFKGSWMLKVLNDLGAEVKGYALEPETPDDLFPLIKGNEICNSIIGDIRNKQKLTNEILNFQPDFVFHLAAQPLVRLSYEIPSETFEVNAIGTANVLDAVALLKNKCQVVMITTDKVYHNNEWDYPYRETDRLGGYDPYSASKACAELVIDSYRNSFFNIKRYHIHKKSIAVARAGNVIGGGDWSKDRLIPDLVKALMLGKPVVLRNPSSVRPWQHVLEPVVGYLMLGQKLCEEPILFSQAFNFGPNSSDTLSVVNMVQHAIETFGTGSYIIKQDPDHMHEAGMLKLDISKVIHQLNFKPKWDASESVKITIEWYRSFIEKMDMIKVVEKQISMYLKDYLIKP